MPLHGEVEVIKSLHLSAITLANARFISFISAHSITQYCLMCLISEAVIRVTVGVAKHLRKLDSYSPFQWRIRWGWGLRGLKGAEGLLMEYKFHRTICEMFFSSTFLHNTHHAPTIMVKVLYVGYFEL